MFYVKTINCALKHKAYCFFVKLQFTVLTEGFPWLQTDFDNQKLNYFSVFCSLYLQKLGTLYYYLHVTFH